MNSKCKRLASLSFTLIELLIRMISMRKRAIFAIAAGLLATSLQGGEMKLLSFYTANHSTQSPKITGTLDDPCWKKAQVYNSYYVYWKPNPGPGKLKTSLRMLWNEKGLFIGITNYDKNMDKIRKVHTTRDSSKLWTDDCAELYFDPRANSVGFTKITVNALGTIADMRQIDAAVKLPSWSASGLEVKTSQNANAWVIEMFVPWSDLGKPAHAGTLWKFCHVRYAWSSGKFVGVTSSPGGNYNNTGNFGFLYFAKGESPNTNTIGKILREKATPPWCLSLGDSLLMYDNNKMSCETLQDIFKAKQKFAVKRIAEIKDILKTTKDSGLKKKFDKALSSFDTLKTVKSPTFSDIRRLNELNGEIDELFWNCKIMRLMQ